MRKILVFAVATLILAPVHLAEAQQPKKIARIGIVSGASSAAGGQNLEAFRQGLRDLGYAEGENIHIEARWADGWAERLPGLITELTQLKVDIMVVAGASAALAAKKA